ncbi:hypothetical protein D3C78_825060 [compost metagenome]
MVHHPAPLHHQYLIGDRPHSSNIVGDEQIADTQLLLDAVEQFQYAFSHQLVEGRGHFIADDQLRFGRQGPGDADALLLPAGQLPGLTIHEGRRVEFDHLQQFGNPGAHGFTLEAQIKRQRPADNVDDALARIQRGVGDLVDHLDAPQLLLAALAKVCRQGFAVVQHLAVGRWQQTGDQPRGGAFATARLADHRQGLTTVELEGNVVQHRLLAITGATVAQFQQRLFLLRTGLGFGAETAHRPQRLGVVLLRVTEHLPGFGFFHQLAVAQHHDAVGHLRHHRQVVADVDRRAAIGRDCVTNGCQHLDLGGDVQRGGRFVEDDQVRMAGHRHGGHDPLQLAAGDLMRIALADGFGIGQAQHPVQLHRLAHGLLAAHAAVFHSGFDVLVDQAMGRVERGCRALCHIGNTQPPQFTQGFRLGVEQVDAVEVHRAAGDPAAVAGVAHGRQAEGRLARAGLADQPQHLAPLQGQVDALDQRMPGIFVMAFDVQVADFQQRF